MGLFEKTETNPLDGTTITKVDIATDRKAIRFCTDRGEVIARTDGDCCSESWIEHIELPALGFPAHVVATEEVEMPEPEQGDHDCLVSYGFKVVTDRGDMLIEYRNSSNGYYGGELVWPGERFYGGVFGQNESEEVWVSASESEG